MGKYNVSSTHSREGDLVPAVNFITRDLGEFVNLNTFDIFGNKRVVLFALPGAFTPTCSSKQVPGFEEKYEDFQDYVAEVYCLSVNDAFVMNAWRNQLDINSVKILPDGSGEFTDAMGMTVYKDNVGFGLRSWRYAMVVNSGVIEKMFVEEGMEDNIESDPFEVSSAENVLQYLSTNPL